MRLDYHWRGELPIHIPYTCTVIRAKDLYFASEEVTLKLRAIKSANVWRDFYLR